MFSLTIKDKGLSDRRYGTFSANVHRDAVQPAVIPIQHYTARFVTFTSHGTDPGTPASITQLDVLPNYDTDVQQLIYGGVDTTLDWSNTIDLLYVAPPMIVTTVTVTKSEVSVPALNHMFRATVMLGAVVPATKMPVDTVLEFRYHITPGIKALRSTTTAEVSMNYVYNRNVQQVMDPSWLNDMQKDATAGQIESSRLDMIAQVSHSRYVEFGSTDVTKIESIRDDSNNIISSALTPVSTLEGPSKRTVLTKAGFTSGVTLQKSVVKSITNK